MGPGAIDEGIALVTAALPRGPIGPYQLQAAIAAVHDEAENPEATDWRHIAALYGVLLGLDDNPIVALNDAVAVSMVAGPGAGLELVQRLGADRNGMAPPGAKREGDGRTPSGTFGFGFFFGVDPDPGAFHVPQGARIRRLGRRPVQPAVKRVGG